MGAIISTIIAAVALILFAVSSGYAAYKSKKCKKGMWTNIVNAIVAMVVAIIIMAIAIFLV